jgi:hypothetical protein
MAVSLPVMQSRPVFSTRSFCGRAPLGRWTVSKLFQNSRFKEEEKILEAD